MMNRFCAPALALLLILGLNGCFFDHPLTASPSKDINCWLLGVWENAASKETRDPVTHVLTKVTIGPVTRVTVLPLSSSRYIVWYRGPIDKNSKPIVAKFEGWISHIDYTSFLSLHCLLSNSPKIPVGSYGFIQYQVATQNNILTRTLHLDSAANATSYELRQEIHRKLEDRSLLSTDVTSWDRVSEVYWDPSEQEKQPFQYLRDPLYREFAK